VEARRRRQETEEAESEAAAELVRGDELLIDRAKALLAKVRAVVRTSLHLLCAPYVRLHWFATVRTLDAPTGTGILAATVRTLHASRTFESPTSNLLLLLHLQSQSSCTCDRYMAYTYLVIGLYSTTHYMK
jgi:hypothetical protein